MKNHKTKRILSVILAVAMLLSMSTFAFATDAETAEKLYECYDFEDAETVNTDLTQATFPTNWSYDGNGSPYARIATDDVNGNVMRFLTTGNEDAGVKATLSNTYAGDAYIAFKYKNTTSKKTLLKFSDVNGTEILKLSFSQENGMTSFRNFTGNAYGKNTINAFDGNWHDIEFVFTSGSDTFSMSIDGNASEMFAPGQTNYLKCNHSTASGIKTIAFKPSNTASGTYFFIDDLQVGSEPVPGVAKATIKGSNAVITAPEGETAVYGAGSTASEAKANLKSDPKTYSEAIPLTNKVYIATKSKNSNGWEGPLKTYSAIPFLYEADDFEDAPVVGKDLKEATEAQASTFPTGWSFDENGSPYASVQSVDNEGNVLKFLTTGNAASGVKKTFTNAYKEDAHISFRYKYYYSKSAAHSGTSKSAYIRIYDENKANTILNLQITSPDDESHTQLFNVATQNWGRNNVYLLDGEWHNIEIDFTAGSDYYTMKIDGTASTYVENQSDFFKANYLSSNGIKVMTFKPRSSSSTSYFYIDDLAVSTASALVPSAVKANLSLNKVTLSAENSDSIKYAVGSTASEAYNALSESSTEYTGELTLNNDIYLATVSYKDEVKSVAKVYKIKPVRYVNYGFEDETNGKVWSESNKFNSDFNLVNTGSWLGIVKENNDQFLKFYAQGNSNYGPMIRKDFGTDSEFLGNVGISFRFKSPDSNTNSDFAKLFKVIGQNAYVADSTREFWLVMHNGSFNVQGDGNKYFSTNAPNIFDNEWHDIFVHLNMNTDKAIVYVDGAPVSFNVKTASDAEDNITTELPIPYITSARTLTWNLYNTSGSSAMHTVYIDDVAVSNYPDDMPKIVKLTESNGQITLMAGENNAIEYAIAKTPTAAASKLSTAAIAYASPFEVTGLNQYIAVRATGMDGKLVGSYKIYGPYSNGEVIELDKFYHLSPWTVLVTGGVENDDTLQLAKKAGQFTLSASDGIAHPEYISDAKSADDFGNALSLNGNSEICVDFNDSYKGSKTIDNIKLVFRTVNKLAAYDFEISYKKADGSYVMFYGDALNDTTSYTNDRYSYMYPTVELSGFGNKLPSDITGLKFKFNANENGNPTDICEIDLNMVNDELNGEREENNWNLSFAKIYSDNMVIQRDKTVKLWGYGGYEGGALTVTLKDKDGKTVQSKDAVVTADQKWSVELDSVAGGLDKYSITVSEKDGDDATGEIAPCAIENILFGDVYLASGQSNMELPLSYTVNQLNNLDYGKVEGERIVSEISENANSNIRFFYYPQYYTSLNTLDDAYGGKWVSGESYNNITGVSAIAYFFAKDLYKELGGEIPIAVMSAYAGGSGIYAWLPNSGNLTDNQISNNTASSIMAGFYNAMIYPYTKTNIKGVIWYQGEANAHEPENYKVAYDKLKETYRGHWGESLDFTAVMLTSYASGNWASMRQGQMQSWLNDKNSGLVNIIDVGNKNDIHPLYKAPVGNRLALSVAARLYDKNVEAQGPLFDKITAGENSLTVSFTHASGLKAQSRTNAYTENFQADSAVKGFEISVDGVNWTAATANINGNEVILTGIDNPKYARYAWANAPECNLFNSDNLPALPFMANINVIQSAPVISVENGTATISGTIKNTESLDGKLQVIIAKYSDDGKLTDVESKYIDTILNENTSYSFTTTASDNMGVMIFNSLSELRPLTYKGEIK